MDAALNWFFLLQGEPDNQELKTKFEAWRSANGVHGKAFEEVATAWALPEADEVAHKLFVQQSAIRDSLPPTNVVPLRRAPKRKRMVLRWVGAVAAALILAIGVQQYPGLRIEWEADYTTTAGVQQEVSLPDGSRVILNTDTAIAFDFEGEARSVRLLKGEAYFDVVRDPSRPFQVTAAYSEVVVKGTAFSVRRDDERDSVALERGRVEVHRLANPDDRAVLEPGEAIMATATSISSAHPLDGSVAFAWLKGQIEFHDQSFQSVLQEIGRYYSHSIIRTDRKFDDVRVNGRYRLDDPERAIRSLATTVGASVTRVPGGILILR